MVVGGRHNIRIHVEVLILVLGPQDMFTVVCSLFAFLSLLSFSDHHAEAPYTGTSVNSGDSGALLTTIIIMPVTPFQQLL